MCITIELATAADYPAIAALLQAHHLPLDGLVDHLETALVARQGTCVVGSMALEVYGPVALLRSAAVATDLQGQGLGARLTVATLDLARRLGVRQVYLLTDTAAGYFPHFGFRAITRLELPEALQASEELRTVCAVTGLPMVLDLSAQEAPVNPFP